MNLLNRKKKGIITKSTGNLYTIYAEGNYFKGSLRGFLRQENSKDTNPIAVGDEVEFQMESEREAIITSIYERKNYIIRTSTNLSKKRHVLAANIDQCFLIITLIEPKILIGFIDRFLVSAEAYKIPVILVFNKIDLYTKNLIALNENLTHTYQKIGYEVVNVSAEKKINLEKLKEKLKSKINLFAGHSGVGKSSLINSLDPNYNLRVGKISKSHKKGTHTTTFATMLPLSFGAWVIDIPGIKSFGLIEDFKKEEIQAYFPEFFSLRSKCFFYNCLHLQEPNCAVRAALEKNEIAISRYENYLYMLAECKDPYK